jgi:hypothetical protein
LRLAGYAALGVAAVLATLEVLFRVLPVSTSSATGYYIDPVIMTYPAHWKFTTATGWNLHNAQRHVANNYGFVAGRDFAPDPSAVALIGDSFVEASMLPPRERLAAQLEALLGARPVYAMGGPGSALLDYAERIRFASSKFGVRNFVLLLEHGDVAQSLCGSGNVHGPCLDRTTLAPRVETQPPPGRLKRILRSLALPQYLFSQLKLDPNSMLAALRGGFGSKAAAAPAPAAVANRDATQSATAVKAVVDTFFERIGPYAKDRLIIVLLGTSNAADASADIVRDELRSAASRNGATLLEPTPEIESQGARTGLSMRVSPTDAHMNRIALGLIAGRVAPELDKPAQYTRREE